MDQKFAAEFAHFHQHQNMPTNEEIWPPSWTLQGEKCPSEAPTGSSAQKRTSKKHNANAPSPLHRPRRKKSSEKERQRNLEIKCHLRTLTGLLPGVTNDIPRIRTLRLAKEYIKHLDRILRGGHVFCDQTQTWRPLAIKDFERVVSEELQTINSYKERAERELLDVGAEHRSPTSATSSSSSSSSSASFA